MSVALASPRSINEYVGGIGLLPRTSPAPVVFDNKLFAFYNGSGDDGIWYTCTANGQSWADIVNVKSQVSGMGVARGTSPAPVVYKDKLYLFYQGVGNDGTFFTTFDGKNWTAVVSVRALIGPQGFLPETSPSATVYDGKLYLFWNGSGDDGIWFTTSNGSNWNPQTSLNSLVASIGIRRGTSPAAVVLEDSLFVFYNGTGLDGTWFTQLKGGSWKSIVSVRNLIGVQGFMDGTSPAAMAMVVGGPWMMLMWNGSGADGLWYTILVSDGTSVTGSRQVSLKDTIGAQPPMNQTNAGVGMSNSVPFIFWQNPQQNMWLTFGKNLIA